MAKEKKTHIKADSLTELLSAIQKDVGKGSIAQGRGAVVDVEAFPTGVAAIDYVLGCGGLPIGRIIELYGRESGGKTTTTLQIAKACQKHYFKDKNRNGVVAFIDAEHAFDPSWARNIGVDLDKLIVSQPDSGEQSFEIVEKLVESELIDLIIVDSVAALTPESILESGMNDANIGALASMMAKGLTKIKGKCNKTKTTVIFINQIREKVGVMFGSPEQTPGGRALKFYASIRMEINKIAPIKERDEVYAFRTRAKVIKNKVAPPFMEAEFDICVGKQPRPVYGIDEAASLIEMADKVGVFIRKGSNYYLGDVHLGNGINNTINTIRTNSSIMSELTERTHALMFVNLQMRLHPEIETDGLENAILDGDDE